MARGKDIRISVYICSTASTDDKNTRLLLGHEERAGGMVCVVHSVDQGLVFTADSLRSCIVGPREDRLGRRCIKCFGIIRQGNAMIELVS
jgi:hypothetical protein